MKDELRQFLTLIPQPPARLTVQEAAWLLGFQPTDIPLLVVAKLIKPLGNPPKNATKFFALTEVLELARDKNWLARATNAVHTAHRNKNESRRRDEGEDDRGAVAV